MYQRGVHKSVEQQDDRVFPRPEHAANPLDSSGRGSELSNPELPKDPAGRAPTGGGGGGVVVVVVVAAAAAEHQPTPLGDSVQKIYHTGSLTFEPLPGPSHKVVQVAEVHHCRRRRGEEDSGMGQEWCEAEEIPSSEFQYRSLNHC